MVQEADRITRRAKWAFREAKGHSGSPVFQPKEDSDTDIDDERPPPNILYVGAGKSDRSVLPSVPRNGGNKDNLV